MSPKAFVDNGYSSGQEFCRYYLSSPEFTVRTLRSLLSSTPSGAKKIVV